MIETRNFWEKYCGKKIPFVIVAYDIWDSRKNEVMGVSVHFYNPCRRNSFQIPVGLETSDSKKAVATLIKGMQLLAAVGIEKEDCFRAVNDTTNNALLAGKLLTDSEDSAGTCSMHVCSLAFGQAMGILTRRKDGEEYDKFEDAENLLHSYILELQKRKIRHNH